MSDFFFALGFLEDFLFLTIDHPLFFKIILILSSEKNIYLNCKKTDKNYQSLIFILPKL